MYNGATVPVPTSGAAAAAAAGAANTASSSGVAATDDPTAAGSSNDDTGTTAANGDVSGATSTSNLSTSSTATDQPTPPGGASLGLIQGPLGMELPSIPYVAIDTYTPRSMRDRSPNSGDPRPTKRPRRSSTAGASGGRGRRGSYSSASAASSSAATAASPTAPAFNPADMLLGGGGNPPSPHSPAFQPLSTRPDGASHFAPPLSSPTDLASLMDDPMDLSGSGSATLAPDTSAAAYSWNQITSQYANATAASLAAYGRAGPPPAPAPPEINYSRLRADSPRSLSPLGESDEEEMVMRRAQMEKAGHDGEMGAEEEQAADKNQPQSEAPPPAPAAANKIARPLPPPPAAFAMATPQSRSGMPSPLLIHQGHVVNGASGEAGTVPNGLGLRVNPIVRPASLHSTAGLPPPPPQSSNASGALTSSGTTSHARSHNGNEPNGGANPGDSPVFSLPMVPPSSAAIADQALLVPSSTSSPSFLPHPLTQPALFPMHHMHHHAHALSSLTHLPLPPPPPPPPPARTVADLDINSTEMHDFLCNTIESLQELARRGVVLQPLVNSVWLNDVTHWRFYTMQNTQAPGGAGSGQAAASETVGATRVGTGASADGQQGSGAGADTAGGAELERHGNGSVTSAGVAQGLQINGLDLADTPVSSSSAAPAPATMTTTRARPLAVPAAPPARLATSGSAAMPRSDSGMALPLTAVGPAGQLMMMPPKSMPGSVEMGFGQQQQQHWASGSAANGFANGEWMMQGGKPDVLGSWQGPFGQPRQQQDQSDQ
ncbi:hypothetical protein BCR44DRAFT_1432289 [Catenaria anguillulae PL171]|uniref:Uncharacterized protein n=1 Tax=Catenaria anguillulae PL171 TaxID=765915 RepID=A0A1Y2HRR1_9FUNG|nr:hypothetical protein BCR44DRAFT_1432289 [Catenaria anguillulae PL171]